MRPKALNHYNWRLLSKSKGNDGEALLSYLFDCGYEYQFSENKEIWTDMDHSVEGKDCILVKNCNAIKVDKINGNTLEPDQITDNTGIVVLSITGELFPTYRDVNIFDLNVTCYSESVFKS